jgi:hypothetical protein
MIRVPSLCEQALRAALQSQEWWRWQNAFGGDPAIFEFEVVLGVRAGWRKAIVIWRTSLFQNRGFGDDIASQLNSWIKFQS